ncbi:CHASE2 domain-containing protein [Candidatus Gracilibacteria bacterium]|nr:CHASE2 domain-containing protein [Candidatus Gracilibacteria bacterium]
MFVNKKIFQNNIFLSVFLSLIVFVVLIIFYKSELGNLADKNIQRVFFNYSGIGSSDDRIVVVEIDETTVSKLGRFPFDRKVYKKLIENLNKAGATVIGFDIIFADKTQSDDDLAKAIKESGNIVLGGGTIKKRTEIGIFESPRDIFVDGAIQVGTFDVRPDSISNIIFSLSPFKRLVNGEYEYFGISILRAYYSKIFNDKSFLSDKMIKSNEYINIKNKIVLPLSSKNTNDFIINFETSTFNRLSFIEIYDNELFYGKQKEKGNKFLKDKIVLVGATLRGIDTIKTPIGEDFGVYIHANFLNTVLTKNFSIYFNFYYELILIFLLSILSIYINLSKSGKILIISNLSIIGIIIIYSKTLNVLHFVMNFPFELIIAVITSIVFSNIAKYIIENKNKNKLHIALSQYVSKEVAEEILSGEGNVKLEGEKRRIAIFFSDIEGFTTLSEKFSPESLILFLKSYLGEMTEIIKLKKGYIDKYEGDAIMALWGAFGKNNSDISKNSCETALLQREKLIALNKKWQKDGIPKINIRIGINTGDAVTGNIGDEKLNYTAIGDNVNLASRLESINKFYSTYICVSQSVYDETKDYFDFRYLDKIKVKGKDIAINIYELIDYKGKATNKEIIEKFEIGINHYKDRDFKLALNIFEELGKLGDKPSLVYIDRCKTFIENPPTNDWDQTWTMTEK